MARSRKSKKRGNPKYLINKLRYPNYKVFLSHGHSLLLCSFKTNQSIICTIHINQKTIKLIYVKSCYVDWKLPRKEMNPEKG